MDRKEVNKTTVMLNGQAVCVATVYRQRRAE